jgi:hypothetical protein
MEEATEAVGATRDGGTPSPCGKEDDDDDDAAPAPLPKASCGPARPMCSVSITSGLMGAVGSPAQSAERAVGSAEEKEGALTPERSVWS